MPTRAHHAFAAEYDARRLVTIHGAVTKFDWSNPHAWLYIQGTEGEGGAAIWSFEMGSPNGLLHRGWTKTALAVGDEVTVDGYAAKDGRKVANARMVRLPNGRRLFGGFQSTPRQPAR